MEITPGNIMLVSAVLLLFSVLAGKAGSRYGMPALLAFLGIGMLAGADGFGIQFDSAATAEFIGMVSLCIILFSGGLDTSYRQIKPVLAPGVVLATVGVLITTALMGIFIHEMMGLMLPDYAFGWAESLLLAAIMSSTDSASVFSILNSSGVGLKQRLKPTLELESGSNDPIAYLLVILLISTIEEGVDITGGMILETIWRLVVQLGVGAVAGIIIGYLTVRLVNHVRANNEFLYPVLVIACCFFAFTLTNMVGGNSYLAVYIAGVVVGNNKIVLKRTIATFFGGFSWLHVPHARSARQSSRTVAYRRARHIARCLYDFYRASGGGLSVSRAVQTLYVQGKDLYRMGWSPRRRAYHLCHLCAYVARGRACEVYVQHRVFHHYSVAADTGYDCHTHGALARADRRSEAASFLGLRAA